MMQPMQGAKRQAMSERNKKFMGMHEWQANLVIERCMAAIHDLGTRPGATRAKIMKALKEEGFTPFEISEAARRMGAE